MDFSGRHYPKDLILQTVRWYLRYSLSYRDMEEILEERGVEIDHTTPYRWGNCSYSIGNNSIPVA